MKIGEKINALMKQKGLSQNRLAKSAQISQSGLSSIISGAVSPKEQTLKAIAEVLECPAWELLKEVQEDITENKEIEEYPITREAQIISDKVDRMPKEQREKALNLMRMVFSEYFEKEEDKIS